MPLRAASIALIALLATACEHTPRTVAAAEAEGPSQLRPDASDVPAAVQAIEVLINRSGALIADEIEIECSCNYVWDVSLSGEDVDRLRPDGKGQTSTARGQPRGTFRNLELRAINRITLKSSGFDVTPYIRIHARGNAAYASATGVTRAAVITIDNAHLRVSELGISTHP